MKKISKKIALISPPFLGHYGVLLKWAAQLRRLQSEVEISFIITGWEHLKLREQDRAAIVALKIKLIELNASPFNIPAPFHFTFPRALELTPGLIEACQNHDLIMYDYFSVEAYIAGKILDIPALCSIRILEPFDPLEPAFLAALAQNKKIIHTLEEQYQLPLMPLIQATGENFFLPSEEPIIQWSWPAFANLTPNQNHRQLKGTFFMRPSPRASPSLTKCSKKTVYFALGSVLTAYLWAEPSFQNKIKKIVQALFEALANHPDYEVIVATGRCISDLMTTIPNNFKVYETVDQLEILKRADIFITHAGANSVNEAIDANVPMIAIPFFGDQYQNAERISQLNIGLSFLDQPSALSEVYHLDKLFETGRLLKVLQELTHHPKFQNAFHEVKAPYEKEICNTTTILKQYL